MGKMTLEHNVRVVYNEKEVKDGREDFGGLTTQKTLSNQVYKKSVELNLKSEVDIK